MPFLLSPCPDCGHKHYTDEACVKPAVKPKDAKSNAQALHTAGAEGNGGVSGSAVRAQVVPGKDAPRNECKFRGPVLLQPVREAQRGGDDAVAVDKPAGKQWRHRDPEAYRAYMRQYMKRKRANGR